MIRIVLLDDHAIVREGIKRLLENEPDMTVCAECGTVNQALSHLQRFGPDVLVVDISLAEGNSFSLVENLAKAGIGVKVLMLSMHDSPAFVGKSLSLGAAGYVTKAAAAKELVSALRRIMAGDTYVSSDIRRPAPSAGAFGRAETDPARIRYAQAPAAGTVGQDHRRAPGHQRQDHVRPPRQHHAEAAGARLDRSAGKGFAPGSAGLSAIRRP